MKIIIIILQAILNLVRKRRDLIANRSKIPPEYRDDVVVWYSPKKQRLTNYDVIEAYVEDFTNWNYVKARGVATISQHKFIITECILKGLSIVEDVREPYSNLTVRIIGITDNQEVLIADYVNGQHQIINTITEDGIYTIEDRHHFIGFGCNFVGTCNITIEQLPTSILKDLSGNGNHAYLYGGKGKLNSGMGLYKVDFTTYYGDVINSYTGRLTSNNKKNLGIAYNKLTKDVEPYTVKVTGIRKETVRFTYRNEEGIEKDILIKNDGYYTVPKCYKDGTQGSSTTFVLYANYDNDTEVIIEQIPDYPDQLCYDGKMYAVCYGFPILEDYTVMADRTWFDKTGVRCFCSKYKDSTVAGLFRFEWVAGNKEYTSSLGKDANVVFVDSNITWQTKTSYNGKALTNLQYEDGEHLIIGDYAKKIGNYYIGCHDDIIILKRSLTINEINDITEAIFNETIIEE